MLELSFIEEQGFFSPFIILFKRCWTAGWTGFFSPNLPVYVAPIFTVTEPDNNNHLDVSQNNQLTNYKPPKKLTLSLINEVKNEPSQEHLEDLAFTLNSYSLEANPENEKEVREALHDLFQHLLQESTVLTELNDSLEALLSQINENRFRLLELMLESNPKIDIKTIKKLINEDSASLINEFTSTLPEQKTDILIDEKTSGGPALIEAASNYASEWVNQLSNASSWAANKFGGFFGGGEPKASHPNNDSMSITTQQNT